MKIEWLMKFLNITDLQAKFIINYPLKKLTPAHLKDYQEEAKHFKEVESHCMEMILDEKKYIVNRFIDKIVLDDETETIHIDWKI